MRQLPNPEPNTAASTMYEWVFDTECGRHMIWSASSLPSLLERVTEKGYRLKFVMELSEYEQKIAEEQRALNAEYEIIDRPPAVA